MAIARECRMKIQGRGIPFNHHQSSCSNRTPENFTWTDTEQEIEIWMDNTIPEGCMFPRANGKKRYAWFCESRAICPLLRQAFDNENILNSLIDAYDGIFTCEKELVDKHEKIHFCLAGSNLPWIPEKNYKIYDKTRLISFISSNKKMCKGHEIRHELYEKIKDVVHSYGTITNIPFGHRPGCHIKGAIVHWHDKSEALNDYMFSVVVENDVYDTYFTEKITDCFATGTVPLYYGPKSIGDYFNTEGVIFLEGSIEDMSKTIKDIDESEYHNRKEAIADNFERVKNMKLADDMIYEKIGELNA